MLPLHTMNTEFRKLVKVRKMKNSLFAAIVFVLSITFICSCSGKTDRSRKPTIQVELSPYQKSYRFGQPLTLKITTKLNDGTLKKTEIYLNDQLVNSGTEAELVHSISALSQTGVNTLRIIAEKKDGVQGVRLQNFTVLSDYSPETFQYRIVREYRHSTDHFTQGLEIHDGFLYEGTGENGRSAIYRKNLSDNKVLKSKSLSDSYFGEGITVLNGKIYQLTYKNQLGFVYDLSDFAVIDSFRFRSPEGWGLTNDGKSLIMSDGTGTLTWMNPQTYDIEKKIEVADDKMVYQYLNELEYDNGKIWANVWTSDLILCIDASNGKVLGTLDLKGILSVMDSDRSDRIDVLNGIAVMRPSGHLLVTGKLWPKMFEIEVIHSK